MKSRNATLAVAIALMMGACVGAADSGTTTPSTGSFQNERVHSEAQVRIWVPDHWRVDDRVGNMLVMADPNDEVSIMFAVVEGEDLLTALLAVTEGVLEEVDDVRLVGAPGEASFNGMDALIQDGTGVVDGVDVDLSVGVVLTPADKFLLIVGLAESGALARHEQTVLAVLEGLKPYQA
jgi:hypothetical protein